MIFGIGDERGRCQEVKSCSVESDMNERPVSTQTPIFDKIRVNPELQLTFVPELQNLFCMSNTNFGRIQLTCLDSKYIHIWKHSHTHSYTLEYSHTYARSYINAYHTHAPTPMHISLYTEVRKCAKTHILACCCLFFSFLEMMRCMSRRRWL